MKPLFSTVIPAHGPGGNIFVILGNAMHLLRELKISEKDITRLRAQVMTADSYADAIAHIEHYFKVERDE